MTPPETSLQKWTADHPWSCLAAAGAGKMIVVDGKHSKRRVIRAKRIAEAG